MKLFHKQPAWTCKCGQVIPKHGAQPSGSPSSLHSLHIHCPNCNKTLAAHINLKETQ